jgi:hypothetical protein
MRSQHALLQFLQVSGLGAVHIEHRALRLGLGGARSSGWVLLAFDVGFLRGGGGGSHGEWNVGDTASSEREGGAVQGEHRTKARFGKERDGEEEGERETAEV